MAFHVKAKSNDEDQRKYTSKVTATHFLQGYKNKNFVFTYKTNYKAQDIYFDTDQFNLFKTGYSLRMRRVKDLTSNKFQYAIQLKNEKNKYKTIRKEFEGKDFDFQYVDTSKVTQIVDDIWDKKDKNKLNELYRWLYRKTDSVISPFQVLKSLQIKTIYLKAVVFGVSERKRYVIRKSKTSENKDLESLDAELILFESSFDESVFSLDLNHKIDNQLIINEFEVEKKFKNKKTGKKIFKIFEDSILENNQFLPIVDSKYKQAIQFFRLQ